MTIFSAARESFAKSSTSFLVGRAERRDSMCRKIYIPLSVCESVCPSCFSYVFLRPQPFLSYIFLHSFAAKFPSLEEVRARSSLRLLLNEPCNNVARRPHHQQSLRELRLLFIFLFVYQHRDARVSRLNFFHHFPCVKISLRHFFFLIAYLLLISYLTRTPERALYSRKLI